MEFKGTKGKWVVAKVGVPNKGKYNTGRHRVGITKSQYGIGGIDIWFGDFMVAKTKEEALYNAQLISKAPEMLDMLQTLLYNSDVPNEIYDQARQLIKEATTI